MSQSVAPATEPLHWWTARDMAAVIESFEHGHDRATADGRTGSVVALTVRRSPTPATVLGDQAAIERAVANLVKNATEHARTAVEVSLGLSGMALGGAAGALARSSFQRCQR